MTTAVEKLNSLNDTYCKVAYFYCSFADSESLEDINILGSVLAQLRDPDDKMYQKLETLYDDRLRGASDKPIRLNVDGLIKLIIEHR